MLPDVSVVIPTYSRPGLLKDAVQSVLRQELTQAFEVVVVDDGGNPPAHSALSALSADRRLRVVRTPNGGPARARNVGLREARAPLVAFLDDDCAAEPGWLAAGVAAFADGVVMVQGPVAPPRSASSLEYHFIDTGLHRHDFSCNLMVRRSVALQLNGFDEDFPFAAGEDFDFCLRAEALGAIVFAPQARATHALLPISWARRRGRPRTWGTYFRLAALHPGILSTSLMVPVLGTPLRPLLDRVTPLRVLLSLQSMQFVYALKAAPLTRPAVMAEELAASALNAAEALTRVPQYLKAWRDARRQARGGSTP